jgi:hypothetical protein
MVRLPDGNPRQRQRTARHGPSDSAHATWRNRVKPAYPSNARIFRSSGFPVLDDAHLRGAVLPLFNANRLHC